MQLVRDHLRRSKSIRDSLQLLTFNSIIEATHLGSRANSILALARHIEAISSEWRQISDEAAAAMSELMKLVDSDNTNTVGSDEDISRHLIEAQAQSRTSLENLRKTAQFAATQAQHMHRATEQMRTQIDEVGAAATGSTAASAALKEWRAKQNTRDRNWRVVTASGSKNSTPRKWRGNFPSSTPPRWSAMSCTRPLAERLYQSRNTHFPAIGWSCSRT